MLAVQRDEDVTASSLFGVVRNIRPLASADFSTHLVGVSWFG